VLASGEMSNQTKHFLSKIYTIEQSEIYIYEEKNKNGYHSDYVLTNTMMMNPIITRMIGMINSIPIFPSLIFGSFIAL
jgi:hypothetical protein